MTEAEEFRISSDIKEANNEVLRGRLEQAELALQAIAYLPIAEQDDMPAANMRAIAKQFLASQQGEQVMCETMERPKAECGCPDCGSSLIDMPTEQAEGAQGELHPDMKRVYDVIGLHYSQPVHVLVTCFQNTKHFADLLHAVEREFFMVPGEPSDEPEDEGCEPDDVCLMNCWGSTQEQYIEQFRSALSAIQTRAALAQPSTAKTGYQWREIGESDWADCDAQWFAYCESSPVHDTRVVAVAQPSPAPELDDQAFDRNAERLTAKAFGTGGGINPNATSIDDLFLDESPAPELERPEVVAWLNTATGTATSHQVQVMDWDDEKEPVQSLMTVAQYDRIVGALLAEIAQLREALEWRKENQAGQRDVLRSVKAERDTAQARVAELHRCLQAIVNAADHGVWPTTVLHAIEMARAMLAGDAPVAQAGQVPEEWQPMSTAPKDGSIIRLLVNFEDMSIDDGDGPFATIGQNNFANDGEDRWQVVGWCWEHDHFTDGKGVPIGWLPMLAAAPAQGGE